MKNLAELISQLPEEEKIILQLHLIGNLDFHQIAEKLNVPEIVVFKVYELGKKNLLSQVLKEK